MNVVKLGSEFLVNTQTWAFPQKPTITSLANGRFVVTWQDGSRTSGDVSGTSIKAQIFTATGAKVGAGFLVNTQTANDQQNPTIIGLANGGFVVTWSDDSGTLGDSTGASIKAQMFGADGTAIGSEFLVNTQTLGGQLNPTIASLANNGFVIAWEDSGDMQGGAGVTSIKAQMFDASGSKQGGEFLVNATTASSQKDPAVASLSNGGFVISWNDEADGSIKAQLFDANGARRGVELSVTEGPRAGSYAPSITELSNGNFVVTWYDNGTSLGDNSGVSINAQLFDASGSKIGSAFLVNTKTEGDQAYPAIADLGNGGFVISWQDRAAIPIGSSRQDEFPWAIKAQVFDANGVKQGSEFLVSTASFYTQQMPTITGLANGDFAVSWFDAGYAKIKAQVFTLSNQANAPVITSDGGGAVAALSVLENITAVTTVQADDAVNFPLTYSISGGADATRFQIDASTGELSFISRPDFEAPTDVGGNNVYDVIVRVSDGVLTDTQALAITVSDIKIEVVKKGDEFLVNTQTADDQTTPSITRLVNGGFVVTWVDSSGTLGDSSGTSIKAQVFNANGSKSGGEFLVNSQTADNQTHTSIAGLVNGGFIITWQDVSGTLGDSSQTSIKGQVFDAGGSKVSEEFLVNSQTESFQTRPTVTGLANGRFVVTWEDSSGTLGDASTWSVKAQLFNANGTKQGGEFLINTQTENTQAAPTIAAISNGGFVISWSDNSGDLGSASDYNVKAQIFDSDGSKLAGEFLVNTTTNSTQSNSTITGLANGGFVITWYDLSRLLDDLSSGSIRAQIFDASGRKVNEEFLVNSQTADDQAFPAIKGLANGGFVATWHDFSGTLGDSRQTSIKAQVFNANGEKQGGEFLVNSQTASFQMAPEITELASGDVVITWLDDSGTLGDASGRSIKAQVFSVTSQNSAPSITSDGGGAAAVLVIPENTSAVTAVLANDVDPGTTLTYAISGGADAARFQINATTGALSFRSAPNFEIPSDVGADNVYDVIVRASDGTLTDTQAISVTVTDANEAPIITSDGGGATATRVLGENATAVTTVQGIDPDAGTTVIYSIEGGADAQKFHVDFLTGALTFVTAPDFEAPTDADGNNVYEVIVRARDGTLDDTQALAVTVTNANEAPVITSDGGGATAARSIAENTTAVTIVQGTDPDAGTTLTYAISGGADAARFQINAATGALSFRSAPNFELPGDVGANNVYDVIVSASDGTLSDTQAIAVTVTDVAEAVRSPRSDFNGDGRGDVLFRSQNGTIASWQLNGTAIGGGGNLGNPGAAFSVAALADFNGDGSTDVLFRSRTGLFASWQLSGTAITGGGNIGNPGSAFALVGSGDFNGDGRSDLLFLNSLTGVFASWQLNGTAITGGGNIGAPGASFVYKATGDFNGDGKSDILFQNANGTYAIWTINGTAITGGGNIGNPGPSWFFKGTGDFNGDGRSDILFQNADGSYATWNLNGSAIVGGGTIGNPGTAFTLAGIDDYNGDGRSDLIFRNVNGTLATWTLNDTAIIGGGNVGNPGPAFAAIDAPEARGFATLAFQQTGGTVATWLVGSNRIVGGGTLGNPGTGWSAKAVADFSGTGESDVLFQHTDGRLATFRSDGSSFIGGGNIGNPGAGWTFRAAADFNGDGRADILFQNSATGVYATWDIAGTAIIGGGNIGTAAGFSFVAAGDLDGDGKADLLFRNAAGTYAAWLVNDTAITGGGNIGNPGADWTFRGLGDFNGDGKSDMLFQNTAGTYASWDLDGTSIVGGGTIGNPGGSFQLADIADLNSDGRSDLLFRDAAGTYASWLINDTAIIGGGNLGNLGAEWGLI